MEELNLIKNPKHKRIRICEKCKKTIGAHESYYITAVHIGGGCALEEYCMGCVPNEQEEV